jgi:hypothetical protein
LVTSPSSTTSDAVTSDAVTSNAATSNAVTSDAVTSDTANTGQDWCKMQIHNSGNFAAAWPIWSRLFGGINHQIEHHLFPNVCNYHYPRIAPIVKRFCIENGFPYVSYPGVYDALISYGRTVEWFRRV